MSHIFLLVALLAVCLSLSLEAQRLRLRFISTLYTAGFTEAATQATPRAALTSGEIAAFLPTRGPFTFPSPYNAQAVRVTNATLDCAGLDGIYPPGYAAWSNINNSAGRASLYVFVGFKESVCGIGPSLFEVHKTTRAVTARGNLFPNCTGGWAAYCASTGEQWYFSATDPVILYIIESGLGDQLKAYNVETQAFVTDATPAFASPIPADSYLWQPHSSSDGLVHSFSVRNSSDFTYRGCGVYDNGTFRYYAKSFTVFNECEIDRSGRWLHLHEDTQNDAGDHNRIIDITGVVADRNLVDANGAPGHMAVGWGFFIGEDNYGVARSYRKWDFSLSMAGGQPPAADGQGEQVYRAHNYGSSHPTWGNATNTNPDGQRACITGAFDIATQAARDNEIVCFNLAGGQVAHVLAPTMIDLDATGDAGSGDNYYKLPFGNLDPAGEWLVWGSNMRGAFIDIFLLKIPPP